MVLSRLGPENSLSMMCLRPMIVCARGECGAAGQAEGFSKHMEPTAGSFHTRGWFRGGRNALTVCLGTIGGPFARFRAVPRPLASLRPSRRAPLSAYLIVTSRVDAVPPVTPHGHALRPR